MKTVLKSQLIHHTWHKMTPNTCQLYYTAQVIHSELCHAGLSFMTHSVTWSFNVVEHEGVRGHGDLVITRENVKAGGVRWDDII